MSAADDSRVRSGMTAQLAVRRERMAAGEAPLGWKVGFGAPAAKKTMGINAPLVGFLMKSGLVASGDVVSLAGWVNPAAEAEIAVHLGRDLGPGADRATTGAAIAAFAPAIELADVDAPTEDVTAILAANLFQRRVVLGARDPRRAGGSTTGLSGVIWRRGTEAGRASDPEAATGDLIDVVRHVAGVLAAFGERLRAGDVIITGAIIPAMFIDPDEEEIRFDLDPVGAVSVRFRR